MRYFIFSLLTLSLLPLSIFGQTLEDAVRYSQLEVGGTARTVGIGGGIGALGADFSVLSTNPAGLATFRRSEFTFTPTIVTTSTESKLEGNNEALERTKLNFNFNNIGLVFPSRPLNINWTNTAFGFGLNRLGSYSQKAYYAGVSDGSITERWANLAQGLTPDNLGFEEGLAYDAEAIYNDANSNTIYYNDFLPGELVERSQLIKRSGSYNELVFSYAGNYRDRLMIGATVGVPLLNFEESKTYVESVFDPANTVFNELTYKEKLNTSGVGINLKVGMIYRVNQMFRLGAAIHTPTGIGLKDSFSSSLDYSYNDAGGVPTPGSAVSPEGSFEYRIRTPWRLIGSAGLVVGKSGFLVAEVEYVDYPNAKFNFNNGADSGDEAYEQELNQQIEQKLQSALNIRLGGEYSMGKFRFRGGYSIMQSPYATGFDPIGTLSLGTGAWINENFFLDLAFRRQLSEGQYSPYLLNNEQAQLVAQTTTRSHFLLTFGFKF